MAREGRCPLQPLRRCMARRPRRSRTLGRTPRCRMSITDARVSVARGPARGSEKSPSPTCGASRRPKPQTGRAGASRDVRLSRRAWVLDRSGLGCRRDVLSSQTEQCERWSFVPRTTMDCQRWCRRRDHGADRPCRRASSSRPNGHRTWPSPLAVARIQACSPHAPVACLKPATLASKGLTSCLACERNPSMTPMRAMASSTVGSLPGSYALQLILS
ncbi:MAG: hypothetical protein RL689_1061 [Planctomycetota bacterium]|jgi:hypothetical protein